MKPIRSWGLHRVVFLMAAAAVMSLSSVAFAQSGEVLYGNASVAPVYDYTTGQTVYILQPLNAPFNPVDVNAHAMSPAYVLAYPVTSTVSTDSLQCLPTNCDHLNVLPFLAPGYDAASDAACQKFNQGNPCSKLLGHIHLFPVAPSGGDFNQAHAVLVAIFTPQGFADHAINTKVTTLSQLQSLLDSGDAVVINPQTPITFHGSIVSEATYERGTPLVVQVP